MKKWVLIFLSIVILIGLLGGCAPIKAQPLGLNEPPQLASFSPEEEALKQEAIAELEELKRLTAGTALFAEIQTIIDKLTNLMELQKRGLTEESLVLKKDIMTELQELIRAAEKQGFSELVAELNRVLEKIQKLIEMEKPPPEELYIYSVKFLLGEAKSEREGVKPANYATAVNIHNFLDESVAVKKKAVIAVPQGESGIVSAYEEFKMGPNWAVEVDGADISQLLGLPFPPKSFIKGFVVIESPKPLNVVAVYTSSKTWFLAGGFSMDIEYISPVLFPIATVVPPVVALTITLLPPEATNPVSTAAMPSAHTVTALVTYPDGTPAAGIPVTFSVTGANPQPPITVLTDNNGQATFTYYGMNAGTDTIIATEGVTGLSATAIKVWTAVAEGLLDLAVEKTVDNPMPGEGYAISHIIWLRNLSSIPATGVAVTDLLPAGVTFISYSASAGTYDSVTGIWSVGTLPAYTNVSLFIYVTVDSGTAGNTITNIAILTAHDQPDTNSANNSDSADITVGG